LNAPLVTILSGPPKLATSVKEKVPVADVDVRLEIVTGPLPP
jgi:hypothetical protein